MLCDDKTDQDTIKCDSLKTATSFLYFIVTQLLHLSDLARQLINRSKYSELLLLVRGNVICFFANTFVSLLQLARISRICRNIIV